MEHLFNLQTFNVNHMNSELSEELRVKISGFKHKNGILRVYISEKLTIDEYNELKDTVENHNGSEDFPLRVFRVLPADQNPLIADFSILGFRKESPSYERGRKTQALYKCVDKEEIIVEKIFNDIRDENGRLTAVQVTFNWYDEDDNISLTKTEIVRKYNKYEAETEERKRRERQIDYLVAGAKDTPIESYINTVFSHYYDEQMVYKQKGTDEFSNAILTETDPTILMILGIEVPRGDDPSKLISVKNSILYQLGAKTLAEIEAENA